MTTEAQTASLEELESWIGREHPFTGADDVSRNDIRRKLEVYCFDCPLHYDDAVARAHGYRGVVAPVTMTPLWSMPAYWLPGDPQFYAPGLRQQTGGIRTDALPTVFSKGVNTATDWEYFEPLYPGDVLEGNWKLVEIKPRQTRLGDGVFLTTETTIVKRSGELVAKNRNTGFRYDEKASDAPREKREKTAAEPPEASGTPIEPFDWSRRLRFGDVTAGDEAPPFSLWLSYQRIVMSVAVDRMYSGIHHNRDQAKASGFNDIIFNTRSYEMLFEVMLRRWMGLDGRLTKLGPFRMIGSSYPDDVVTARARVTGVTPGAGSGRVQLEIVAVNGRGEAARGEAEVALPNE
ncbi:MAG TPA: MaoC family dehydratase N-terminal domain-containing protein [Candidatus Lustribacter sp.]|jgi:acyl dehydratase|nr:MaoC family dehydratase N-terminal domain-containing protein [Candidatus Lustribacter sp.]